MQGERESRAAASLINNFSAFFSRSELKRRCFFSLLETCANAIGSHVVAVIWQQELFEDNLRFFRRAPLSLRQ